MMCHLKNRYGIKNKKFDHVAFAAPMGGKGFL